MRERRRPARREPGPDGRVADGRRLRLDVAGLRDDSRLPELLEIGRVGTRDLRGVDAGEQVLLERPGSLGPVRRAGQHRAAVANGVLVMHEVRDPGNRPRCDRQALDELRDRPGRRRDWDRSRVVDVVGKPHANATFARLLERPADGLGLRAVHLDVVEGEIEGLPRLGEESRDELCDRECGLLTGRQRRDLEHRILRPRCSDVREAYEVRVRRAAITVRLTGP